MQGYHRGSCFNGMGWHYFKDLAAPPEKMSWQADNLMPVVPMYDPVKGRINAIFFSSAIVQQAVCWQLDVTVCSRRCVARYPDPSPKLRRCVGGYARLFRTCCVLAPTTQRCIALGFVSMCALARFPRDMPFETGWLCRANSGLALGFSVVLAREGVGVQ